jgi:hypothetical protein
LPEQAGRRALVINVSAGVTQVQRLYSGRRATRRAGTHHVPFGRLRQRGCHHRPAVIREIPLKFQPDAPILVSQSMVHANGSNHHYHRPFRRVALRC